MAFLRPNADDVDGLWVDQNNGTSLFEALDEASASDADYIKSSPSPEQDITRIALSDPDAQGANTAQPVTVRYRYWKYGPEIISLKAKLKQGAAVIAEWTHSAVSETPVTAAQVLTQAEKDSITDWNDLKIELEANPIQPFGYIKTQNGTGGVITSQGTSETMTDFFPAAGTWLVGITVVSQTYGSGVLMDIDVTGVVSAATLISRSVGDNNELSFWWVTTTGAGDLTATKNGGTANNVWTRFYHLLDARSMTRTGEIVDNSPNTATGTEISDDVVITSGHWVVSLVSYRYHNVGSNQAVSWSGDVADADEVWESLTVQNSEALVRFQSGGGTLDITSTIPTNISDLGRKMITVAMAEA